MKCKDNMFVDFSSFFLKCLLYRLWHFFLAQCLSNQFSFSVIVRISKIHVFDEVFFIIAIVPMIREKVYFFCFNINHCLRNKFFHLNQAPYQFKLPWYKGYSKQITQRSFFYSIAKDADLNIKVKMQQKFILDFYHHFSYSWVDLICIAYFISLESLWWSAWIFCARDLLKRRILSRIICVLLNIRVFQKNLLLGCLLMLMSEIKNVRELT